MSKGFQTLEKRMAGFSKAWEKQQERFPRFGNMVRNGAERDLF